MYGSFIIMLFNCSVPNNTHTFERMYSYAVIWLPWTNHLVTQFSNAHSVLHVRYTHYSELLIEVLQHMRSSFLSKLLEVGIGVKGLQVADQDVVTHFIVNLCMKDILHKR